MNFPLRPWQAQDYLKFYSNVRKSRTCWVWTSSLAGGGYGAWNGTTAHRAIYAAFNGSIPKDIDCCHKCDNRLCVNLDHLFLGTRKDNMQDAKAKGRLGGPTPRSQGERNHNSKLTETQVLHILEREMTPNQYAKWYNVSRRLIRLIQAKTAWKHINVKFI